MRNAEREHLVNDTTTLPANFRHVRLLLAREKAHPEGALDEGYDLLLPLDNEGRLDPHEWKTHQASCRIRRFDEHRDVKIGRLRRKPGGQWYFDYEEGERDDEKVAILGLRPLVIRWDCGRPLPPYDERAERPPTLLEVFKAPSLQGSKPPSPKTKRERAKRSEWSS